MTINKVTFNSVNFWDDLGAALTAPVAYPIPAEIKEKVKIKGMNGSLTEATGYFNDLEIKLKFKVLFKRAREEENRTFNGLKRTINSLFNIITDDKFIFSDVPDRYYKIKSAGVGAVAKLSDYEAEFNVTFICDPFLYDPNELPIARPNGQIFYNGDVPNKPIITFSAKRGHYSINCNGRDLSFEVTEDSAEIKINDNPYATVMMGNKPLNSVGVEPIFSPGPNNITISGNVSNSTLKKNERYLG